MLSITDIRVLFVTLEVGRSQWSQMCGIVRVLASDKLHECPQLPISVSKLQGS
jgi:hypothetical protein